MGDATIIQRVDMPYEELLSMELIRAHTKTDDTPHVTDEQIDLYRQAGFEQAEKYTGRIFTGVASVQEMAETMGTKFRRKNVLTLKYPTIDGIISVYGMRRMDETEVIMVPIGTRKVKLPVYHVALDVNDCCGGCGRGATNFAMKLMYRAGTKNAKDIPAGVIAGILRYIAWSVSNPGDELLTVRNRLGTTETGLIGTNNAAWASGAIEAWRLYRL